jgi:uncharacterized protein YqhQ
MSNKNLFDDNDFDPGKGSNFLALVVIVIITLFVFISFS